MISRVADRRGSTAGTPHQRAESGPPAAAKHELGGVLGSCEAQQRLCHAVADDLVVGPAQALDQLPLGRQVGRACAGQPVGAGDVHGEQVAAGRPCRDARRSPDQE